MAKRHQDLEAGGDEKLKINLRYALMCVGHIKLIFSFSSCLFVILNTADGNLILLISANNACTYDDLYQ